MKKSEKIALIDLDGTLANYDKAMRRDMELISGPNDPINWYDGAPEYIIARKKLIQDQPDWWFNLEPIPLGLKIVEIMGELGFQRMILTKGPSKRNHNAWTEKVRWCKKHVPEIPITITQSKGLVYGKILMDDWPDYVTEWLEWRPRGLVLMMKQPWNVGFQHKNVLKFSEENIEEVREQLQAITNE